MVKKTQSGTKLCILPAPLSQSRQPLNFVAGNAGNHIFLACIFFASRVSAFERMYHIGRQHHSCFFAFQLGAFTQQAKVRIKTAVEKKNFDITAIETVAVTGNMHQMYENMLRAQTKYRERYILRLVLVRISCLHFFVNFSHPRHPTLASFSN